MDIAYRIKKVVGVFVRFRAPPTILKLDGGRCRKLELFITAGKYYCEQQECTTSY
jgi:hypothetical protein